MIICHKPDTVADLTTVSRSKLANPLHQLTSSIGDATNLLGSLLIAVHQDLARQRGEGNACLHAIKTRLWSTPGESFTASLTILNRTAAVD